MNKNSLPKKVLRIVFFKVLILYAIPFIALGWWLTSDDTFIESVKKVWKSLDV